VKHVHVIGDACIAGAMPNGVRGAQPGAAMRGGDLRIAGRPAGAGCGTGQCLLQPAQSGDRAGHARTLPDLRRRIEQIEAGNGRKQHLGHGRARERASAWYRDIPCAVFWA